MELALLTILGILIGGAVVFAGIAAIASAVGKGIESTLDSSSVFQSMADPMMPGYDKRAQAVQEKFASLNKDFETSKLSRPKPLPAPPSIPAQKPKKTKPAYPVHSDEKLEALARRDAKTGDYQILYSQSKKKRKVYNQFYKSYRQEIIQGIAATDARNIHQYDIGKLRTKSILKGRELSIPAEIAMYQNIFVKEIAELKAEHQQMLKDKNNVLQELYSKENSSYIEQDKFYESFQKKRN